MKQSIQQANQFGTQWVEIIPKYSILWQSFSTTSNMDCQLSHQKLVKESQ